jgi:ADP-dependent NAD(P)H-hydrate dehydratase / NAD(P)H-hydrate epimerase
MSLPILSVAQMREWEQATWAAGQTETEVIRRVGQAVAHRALQLTRPDDLILLLAGRGHNGSDVRAARAFLPGRRVELLEVQDPATDLAALRRALHPAPALIVDGLFGIGINRPLEEPWQKLIQLLNSGPGPVLAVDVPSGLNADTGEVFGAAIRTTITLAVGAPKTGLLAAGAGPYVGRLEVAADVGLRAPGPRTEMQWVQPQDFQGFPPARPVAGHKGTFGHLAILAGSVGYHGAAVLATRGALRAQPGLVTTLPLAPAYLQVASQLQSAMVKAWAPDLHFPGDFSAVLVGPGLAAKEVPEELVLAVRKLWRDSQLPLVVDASALDWLPMDHVPRHAIRVITPHPGEAARLAQATPQQVQQNRGASVRDISKRFGNCWVVLKGHQTVIGRSTGELGVNSSGNPQLAQGGSGDVLAGYLAGLLAQPALQADVGRTLSYAVWQHGAAADTLSARRRNWTIEDLVDEIGNVV